MRIFCFDNTGFLLLAWFILFMIMDSPDCFELPAPTVFPNVIPSPTPEPASATFKNAPPPQAESNAPLIIPRRRSYLFH